ncbi:DUF3813 domain-containing protein [Peribacillus alkalitolerans]|uniref:DUF3813 domain-containing protein n=1 Tax=Peribacillus alkalitolerans TaxID=1550385 RepID=UPI0013D50004|nr:DUF3813 domain-containing protein [Peribacillus alkalitolerans]
MGNHLFQEARNCVNQAVNATEGNQQQAIEKAQNALSSAYANSTVAEQAQLSQMQEQLDSCK